MVARTFDLQFLSHMYLILAYTFQRYYYWNYIINYTVVVVIYYTGRCSKTAWNWLKRENILLYTLYIILRYTILYFRKFQMAVANYSYIQRSKKKKPLKISIIFWNYSIFIFLYYICIVLYSLCIKCGQVKVHVVNKKFKNYSHGAFFWRISNVCICTQSIYRASLHRCCYMYIE